MKIKKNILNSLVLTFLILSLHFLSSGLVNAVSPTLKRIATDSAQKTALTFPIVELGNCANKEACRKFCVKVENKDVCLAYAKSHGIGAFNRYNSLVQQAKRELGCQSVAECRRLCSLAENKAKCVKFGEKFLPKEVKDKNAEMLQKAKEILGCSSMVECKTFCKNAVNREKCIIFSQSLFPQGVRKKTEEILNKMRTATLKPSFAPRITDFLRKLTPFPTKTSETTNTTTQ